ncbi:beta strand repeat-containing protein [Moraxella cuniculi]|uniref:Uncharacterized protein n=1 Tax=Moraxella cuniculi TaxID=34061 RepID=A0A448GYZ2_9GAMM|nr:hypothetical protein [Moraxella cuniculi]VEG14017.1 Uncharacterised protein [Moraxella cuniculi]
MKNIIVKINDAVQTVQEVNVVTNDGQPTVIKATKNVNYQFIDRATGRGPDHIVTKRVGQDLHISLEDEGKESDLIIEGFYDQDGAAALIGQAENGQYYYYVPDTGEVADYVTQLVPGDIEGQALGGESVVAPWWLGATQTKAAIWPWLLGGLLGAGAIAALANDDDDKSSNDNNPTTPVQPTPKTTKPTVVLTNKDTDGDGQDDTTTISGKTDPNADVTITLPDGRTITTKANDKGEYSVDVPKLNEGDKVTVTAKAPGKETSDPTEATVDTAADKPEVVANDDGSVTSTPGKDSVKNTTKYTDEDDNEQIITATKQPDGTWKATDKDGNELPTAPDANNPKQPWVDPTTGTVTLPPDAVKDNTPVEATSTDANNNTADDDATSKNDPKNAKVISSDSDNDGNPDGVTTTTTPVNEGEVLVTKIKLDNNNGVDNLVIGINSPDTTGVDGADFDLTNVTFTNGVTSNGDGTVNVPPGVTEFEIRVPVKADNTTEGDETGKVAVGNPDGSVVEGNTFTVTDSSKTPAEKPTVTPSTKDGSVTVNPGTDNDEVPITFTGEDNQPKKVTAKKDTQTNTWTLDDPNGTGATINPQTGEVTIPQDSVKDGEKVTAIGKETGKNDSEPVDGNAGTDTKNATVDNTNKDGVVTQNADEGKDVVTTVKLTNNNGANNLSIDVAGTGTTPANPATDLAAITNRTFTAYDKDGKEVTNGVTANQNGSVNVKAGVVKFDIKQQAVADSTTEGAETLTYTVGGVKGNEATINDTSTAPKTAGVEELYLQEWLEEGDETTKTADVGTIVLTNDTGADDIPFSFTGTAKAGKEGATTADTDFTVYNLIARDADTNEVPGGITYTVNADGSGTFSVAPGVKYVGVRLNIIKNQDGEPSEPFTMKVGKTGNELTADSAIAADKPPVVNISVSGDLGPVTAPLNSTTTANFQATMEDNDTTTGLTYTVTLDQTLANDLTVKVKLGDDNVNGRASSADIKSVTLEDGSPANYDAATNTVTLTVKAGKTSASFLVDPVLETFGNAFNHEGQEKLVATVQADSNYRVGNNSTATGLIVDGNAITLNALNGDMTLYYGQSAANVRTGDFGYTIATAVSGDNAGTAIVTSNGADTVYIGYYADGTVTSDGGNIANYNDLGPARTSADNAASITTVDLGAGDDTLMVREDQNQATRVYLGEGNDEYILNGSLFSSLNSDATSADIFAEAGNDTVTIKKNVSQSNIYLGSGSDTLTIEGNINTFVTIDLGSGDNMPATYLREYNAIQNANGRSLGNDNNTDLATDTNTVNLGGKTDPTQLTIKGGAGTDIINLKGAGQILDMTHVSGIERIDLTGTGNNIINYLTKENLLKNDGLYITGNAGDKVNLGPGGYLVTNTAGFAKSGTTTVDGVTYDIWSVADGSTSKVYIQQGIEVV